MSVKSQIRKQIRQQRRRLSPKAQQQAAVSLSQQLLDMPDIQRSRRIAAYWPSDGEIDPMPLLRKLARRGKKIYLPVVLESGHLHFRQFRFALGLWKNRYGILEPVGKRVVSARKLDLVLMPLVAFDRHGNRLGMGGGYYDRTFAFKHQQPWRQKPQLIGLAHHFQQQQVLASDSWDVPMSVIATDKQLLRC